MSIENHTSLTVQIAHSITEIGQIEWDALSASRPFQSYHWYAFGEHAMADCLPVYIILSQGKKAVARATCWLVRDEPLPVGPRVQPLVRRAVRRWPLLICRSPLSGANGLILPEPPLREFALQTLAQTARQELRRLGGSFLIFDYLGSVETKWHGWPKGFKVVAIPDPGTKLTLKWDSFDSYLKSRDKKDRQHYTRSVRKAENLGVVITRHNHIPDIGSTITLIRNVEKKYGGMPNPWATGMLTNMDRADGTFLAAHIKDRLVGCGLVLVDNGTQLTTALGLAGDTPYVYLSLVYASLKTAFTQKVGSLRWGSGAYEIKRHLGFELEDNNQVMLCGANPVFNLAGWLAGGKTQG